VEDRIRYEDADFLEACYREIWSRVGASDEHAAIMAKCTSHGDRMGKHLQGLGVFEIPIMMVRSGNLDIDATPEIVAEGPGWVLADGNRSSGQWTVSMATARAIEKAREMGVALALGRNHNDAGCYSAFTMQAIAHGMIGIGSNNGPPLVSPWGGMENVMSPPPFSVAAPGGDRAQPLVVDVQLLEADDGHVAEAALNGTKISGPYLVDPATGEATDDPTNFFLRTGTFSRVSDINGATVFSSPRIYALNVAVEVLTAIMVPEGVLGPDIPALSQWDRPHPTTSVGGSFMIVIDPSHFIGADEYRRKLDRYVDIVKGARRLPGVEEIFMPGERGLRSAAAGEDVGVLRTHWESFERIAADYGLDLAQARANWNESGALHS
jgi:LDH2 family malate/lactate/ureidoglycolate dehydrogenase